MDIKIESSYGCYGWCGNSDDGPGHYLCLDKGQLQLMVIAGYNRIGGYP